MKERRYRKSQKGEGRMKRNYRKGKNKGKHESRREKLKCIKAYNTARIQWGKMEKKRNDRGQEEIREVSGNNLKELYERNGKEEGRERE